MNYLLDTNACIAVIDGRPEAVRSRLEQALDGESRVWVSSVVAFDLWYGVTKSSRPEANARRLADCELSWGTRKCWARKPALR